MASIYPNSNDILLEIQKLLAEDLTGKALTIDSLVNAYIKLSKLCPEALLDEEYVSLWFNYASLVGFFKGCTLYRANPTLAAPSFAPHE